jgi:hypothetical protein
MADHVRIPFPRTAAPLGVGDGMGVVCPETGH